MKLVAILALALTVAGCSTQATKDTRAVINQNTDDIATLQAEVEECKNKPEVEVDTSCPAACSEQMNEKLNRVFEHTQYK